MSIALGDTDKLRPDQRRVSRKEENYPYIKGILEVLFIVEAEYSGRTWQLLIRQHLLTTRHWAKLSAPSPYSSSQGHYERGHF